MSLIDVCENWLVNMLRKGLNIKAAKRGYLVQRIIFEVRILLFSVVPHLLVLKLSLPIYHMVALLSSALVYLLCILSLLTKN